MTSSGTEKEISRKEDACRITHSASSGTNRKSEKAGLSCALPHRENAGFCAVLSKSAKESGPMETVCGWVICETESTES